MCDCDDEAVKEVMTALDGHGPAGIQALPFSAAVRPHREPAGHGGAAEVLVLAHPNDGVAALPGTGIISLSSSPAAVPEEQEEVGGIRAIVGLHDHQGAFLAGGAFPNLGDGGHYDDGTSCSARRAEVGPAEVLKPLTNPAELYKKKDESCRVVVGVDPDSKELVVEKRLAWSPEAAKEAERLELPELRDAIKSSEARGGIVDARVASQQEGSWIVLRMQPTSSLSPPRRATQESPKGRFPPTAGDCFALLDWYTHNRKLGALSDDDIAAYVWVVLSMKRAVEEALAALHAAGLAHRDIKPGNISYAFEPLRNAPPHGEAPAQWFQRHWLRVQVIDLGFLARCPQDAAWCQGTKAYIPAALYDVYASGLLPTMELLQAADRFALGMSVFFMLFGDQRLDPHGRTQREVLMHAAQLQRVWCRDVRQYIAERKMRPNLENIPHLFSSVLRDLDAPDRVMGHSSV